MSIKDIADRIRDNGYMPVPLVPCDKAIKVPMWSTLASQGKYDELWADAYSNANIGIFTGQNVIIMDFDAKGDEPNIGVFDHLSKICPEILEGAIIERTPSGGIHITYKWTSNAISLPTGKGKTYARFEVDGKKYDVELLTRGAQAVCPPSHTIKRDKNGAIVSEGDYTYIGERTHLNTKRDVLAALPEVIRDANNLYLDETMLAQRSAERIAKANTNHQARLKTFQMLRSGELDIVIEVCVKAYQKNAKEGNRHPQALGLAQNVAGLPGAGRGDIERAVKDFYRGVHGEEPTQCEINGIIKYGYDNPDSDPFLPMDEVISRRKKASVEAAISRRVKA